MSLSNLREQVSALPGRFLERPGARQLMRYAVGGFFVTQFAALIYSLLAAVAHVNPLLANVVSTACGVCGGYLVHNHWSFPAGNATDEYGKAARFAVTTFLAFLFNAFWIWLLVASMRLPPLAPVPFMMFVTPWASFLVNRHWVFKAA